MATATELADEMVEVFFDAFPLGATLLGLRGRDDQMPDFTAEGEEANARRVEEVAERAARLAPAELSESDRVTRAVMLQQAVSFRDRTSVCGVEYTISEQFSAPVAELLALLPLVGIAEQAQADGYLARLAAFPGVLEDVAERNRTGLAAGRLPVQHLVHAAAEQLDRYLENRDDSPLRRPGPAPGAPVAESFAADRDRALEEVVRPALARYRDVLIEEIAPKARPADRPGLCWLPEGTDMYARMIRVHTSTERAPEDLHQTGLDLIARLDEEYARIGQEAFGVSDPAAVRDRLRTDPALRWRDGDELLASARAVIARAEEAAPRWFGRLPSQACTVEEIPADDAPGASAAYYVPPAMDGTRPGIYFANTYRAAERDRYSSEAVAFHEAVPGHHFQLTLAQELTDLPLLRRFANVNAFDEGWGLYAERLADEMGLYSGPIERLGMLAADSLRAARLVVDTGLHAKAWTRQQVVDYLTANTALLPVEIASETDRYIADPGQALAYMVGRLEIQRIRAAAERALGTGFDIRAFHDVVLGQGPLPLGVLDEVVMRWAAGPAN